MYQHIDPFATGNSPSLREVVITQSQLDDVQEDVIVDKLIDTNEYGMLLNAIASDNDAEIASMVRILKAKAVSIREELARG